MLQFRIHRPHTKLAETAYSIRQQQGAWSSLLSHYRIRLHYSNDDVHIGGLELTGFGPIWYNLHNKDSCY